MIPWILVCAKAVFSDLKRANGSAPRFNLEIRRTLLHFVNSALGSKESAWKHRVLLKVTRKVLCRRSHWCCSQKWTRKGDFFCCYLTVSSRVVTRLMRWSVSETWLIELSVHSGGLAGLVPTQKPARLFFSAHPSLLKATSLLSLLLCGVTQLHFN